MHNKFVGEESISNQSHQKMTIINWRNTNDIDIQFEDGTIVYHKAHINFKRGEVKNPFYPFVCGVGYYGADMNTVPRYIHIKWVNMLKRCYDILTLERCNTYIGCEVCEEWHNLQNFYKWYKENEWTQSVVLECEKDILTNNKIYSPQTCVLVPHDINMMFTHFTDKPQGLPQGIVCNEHTNFRYNVGFHKNGKRQAFGTYNTLQEAQKVLQLEKQKYLREKLLKYKNEIPQNLYDMLYNYNFEREIYNA
jgi:hypothetical protein